MLDIRTFDARQGGNVLYKALAHPLAAEAVAALYARLAATGPVVVVDPDAVIEALLALYPAAPALHAVYVQDAMTIGQVRAGLIARPLTELPASGAAGVLVAAFDAQRLLDRIRHLLPAGAEVFTLDALRLPAGLLTQPHRSLDRLNYATSFCFFRDAGGLSTRLVTANYWAGYGAGPVLLWLRLFGEAGEVLATWEEPLPQGQGGVAIDSAEVRARFGLPAFTGQLFVHAIGVAGHDVVKYALDTFGTGTDASLSCTHDANAWPSDRYAGLPAPAPGERVILWVQNSHAAPIPAGALQLDRMGAERPVAFPRAVPGFATVALDVADLLPGLAWPAQIELRAGRHVVRPRYEVVRGGRTRIAHVNVERADLLPDPNLPSLPAPLGRGYLLPLPVLPRGRFRTLIQPTPMATTQDTLPLRLDVFDPQGVQVAAHFLGCLRRDHAVAVDLDELLPAGALAEGGHADLVYDFRQGGSADGWLHALVRAEHRDTGHAADSSFGAHMFNLPLTWRDEPQSYAGPPPGLSTRLFLKLGEAERQSFALLIYPASGDWHSQSDTALVLHDGAGQKLGERRLEIARSGSALVQPQTLFGEDLLERAGPLGWVLVRDTTCRLFGYHGLMAGDGRFSLDHMFGF
jgi:hypothetical protein